MTLPATHLSATYPGLAARAVTRCQVIRTRLGAADGDWQGRARALCVDGRDGAAYCKVNKTQQPA